MLFSKTPFLAGDHGGTGLGRAFQEELIDPFVETVAYLLKGKNNPKCITMFRDRAKDDSEAFIPMTKVYA